MSGAVVTKSSPELVVPSESEKPTPLAGDTTLALSSFDLIMFPFPMKLLLAFDHPIHNPVSTIKTALSRALAHYHPVAGRLDGNGGIACSGEGVTFVAAWANCHLDDAMDTLQHMDLTVRYPGSFCRDIDPLLLMQVTEFTCGAFTVGVTWNHVLADGKGIGQFLLAVGELARGVSSPSVTPVRHWDDSLPGLPSSMVAAQKATVENDGPRHLVRHDIAIPSSLISRVKADSGGATVFEAVAAVIWSCRTRAAMSMSSDDESSPAPIAFPCNVRALVGAKEGYYGNCVLGQVVMATSGAVARSSLADLVRLIRRAKEKVPDMLFSGGGDGGGGEEGEAAEEAPPPRLEWYNGLTVVSWLNLGFDVADFGGGGAARVMWHEDCTLLPGCMVCPPCRGDEVNVSALCVKPEHADVFLEELASLAAAT